MRKTSERNAAKNMVKLSIWHQNQIKSTHVLLCTSYPDPQSKDVESV
uniref:Uncharacterized protein n=1 Tax=Rhizophora mucronata TaxID=61149 RepID=A0A2P2N104_RHIMU